MILLLFNTLSIGNAVASISKVPRSHLAYYTVDLLRASACATGAHAGGTAL